MKRTILILPALLMLTACAKAPVEQTPAEQPAEIVTEETTTDAPVEEIPVQIVEPAEETVITSPEEVSFTVSTVEGLVEDTVGYSLEVPYFDVPGGAAIEEYYEKLASHLEGYTKETVYQKAAERACIVSVYGYVASAAAEGEILSVDYVYSCDYSDTDESEENLRTDRFNMVTGELLEA
ncbi:MAG: membrane lipoprotein lipid attachment site-containing protein [Oscillospiraceae bacterium]|nr:membrane lipoprotein lipid attachment site-containing protein [Oscillospiraceae bacterium]